jgi:hypothetical protein
MGDKTSLSLGLLTARSDVCKPRPGLPEAAHACRWLSLFPLFLSSSVLSVGLVSSDLPDSLNTLHSLTSCLSSLSLVRSSHARAPQDSLKLLICSGA